MASFVPAPSMRLFVLTEGEGEDRKPVMTSDEESVDYRLANVELSFDKDQASSSMGRGVVHITQSRILWLGAQQSFDFDVRFIALHAISRDADSYPLPCLYCQFARDEPVDDGQEADADEDDMLQNIAANALEMFLAPDDEAALLPLFEAFSNASLMNPDPVEPGHEHDAEDDDELIYNLDEVEAERGNRVLMHLESLLP